MSTSSGALAFRCSGDVQSCSEGSRRSHDGEVASGYVAGKTFPYGKTYCGKQERRPCDQIKGSEGDIGTDDDG